MEKKSSLEINMIKNVERILINVFDDEEDKEEQKDNSPKLNRQYSVETPKLFINDQLLSETEKNPPKFYLNNKMQSNNINEDLNLSDEIPPFSFNEQGEKIEKIIANKNSIDMEDYNKLKGNFLNLITSQNGSRFMQKIYANSDYEVLQKIFNEISSSIADCMIDPYANYFCQKFFGVLKKEERKIFLNSIINKIIDISNSKIGTYPLQAVIAQLDEDEEISLIMNAIHGKIIDLCNNAQGVHVIEKMILCFEETKIQEIYDSIIDNFIQLSTNPNGLFVCKKIIYQSKKEENLLRIREVITKNSMTLIYNQYGNYTIQVAIDTWSRDFSQPIIQSFSSHLINLSCQKYSSNVIEKCIEKSDNKLLGDFIDEISKNSNILALIKNSFGNFVLQKALKLSSGRRKTKLTNSIKKSLDKLSDKKLIKKWKTILSSSSHLNLNLENNINQNNSFFSSGDHISSSPISERGNNNSSFTNTFFSQKDNFFRNMHTPRNSPMIRPQLSVNNSPFATPIINSPLMSPMRLMNMGSPINSPLHSPLPGSPIQGSPICSPSHIGRTLMINNNLNTNLNNNINANLNNFNFGMRSNTLMIPPNIMLNGGSPNINIVQNQKGKNLNVNGLGIWKNNINS